MEKKQNRKQPPNFFLKNFFSHFLEFRKSKRLLYKFLVTLQVVDGVLGVDGPNHVANPEVADSFDLPNVPHDEIGDGIWGLVVVFLIVVR